MEDKLCSTHDNEIIVVCLFEGCPQLLLCFQCIKEHPDSHGSKTKSISSLIKNVAWIKSIEELRDSHIAKIKKCIQDKESIIDENENKLKEMVPEIIQDLKNRLWQWTQELDNLFGIDENLADREAFTKLQQSLGVLASINFQEGGVYEKVEKVKLFMERTLPESIELCQQVQSVVEGNRIDQQQVDMCKEEILEFLQNIHIKDLLRSKEFKQNKVGTAEQLAIQQQGHNEQVEALNKKVETLENEQMILQAELNSAKEENDQLIQDDSNYQQKLVGLEETNKELENQVSMLKLSVDALTISNLVLEKKLESLNESYTKLKMQYESPNYLITLSESSRIINSNDFHNLRTWLQIPPNFNKMTTCSLNLLYRASRDGFTPSRFYAKCGYSAPTISFIRSKEHRRVFGGYTTKSWGLNIQGWIEDKDAFLFSLTHSEKYPVKMPQNAIYISTDHILCFGGGGDINLREDCNIRQDRTNNFFPQKYECPRFTSDNDPGAQAYLAGSERFSVEEIEVYQVVWLG